MDRLARSAQHLLEIVEGLERKGVALRLLDFKGHRVDTHSRQGRLLLTMFAAFAQFERELMLERQPDGKSEAEADGRRKGRKPTAMAKADEVGALAAGGVGRPRSAAGSGLAARPSTACSTDRASARGGGSHDGAALERDVSEFIGKLCRPGRCSVRKILSRQSTDRL